jgi:hypothetical protein
LIRQSIGIETVVEDEPISLTVIGRLTVGLIIALLLPQALGFLGYRWTRGKHAAWKAITIFIPPVTYFIIAFAFWNFQAESLRRAGEYVCGLFGAAAVYSTLYGTAINLGLAMLVFLICTLVWKRQG